MVLNCERTERRRRDLNPRAAINDLLPFQGSPFSHLGTSPKLPDRIYYIKAERVGFEPTRPCGQTVFKTASLWPLRYLSMRLLDYYISFPTVCQELFLFYFVFYLALISAKVSISSYSHSVNNFFRFFSIYILFLFFSISVMRIRSSGVVILIFS